MTIDLQGAQAFMATHARLLDRRRFELLIEGRGGEAVLAAVDGYRNHDGGYGWGLEGDLRSTESQPATALHAFEAFAEVGAASATRAKQLCDWLSTVTLPDGGLPFSVPVSDPAGCGPWWIDSDGSESSLQITAIVAANAHRVATQVPELTDHEWLRTATDYCLRTIEHLDEEPHALVVLFAVQLLDCLPDQHGALLDRLGRSIPDDGLVQVQGGTEDEVLRPLDFASEPDGPARRLFSAEVVVRELDRLASLQQADGGWPYEPATFSPAAALEWRGYITVHALRVLRRNGRLVQPAG